MFRLAQLSFLLWLCATGVLGESDANCTVVSQNKEACGKEFLWILFAIIETPFRRAEQLALNFSQELTKNEQKKLEIDEAIESLSGKPRDPQNDLSLRSQLGNQSVALKKIIELYRSVLANVKSSVEHMKKTTVNEYDAIGRLNVVSGRVWDVRKPYGGDFEDLRKTFELIERREGISKHETFANEYVENAVAGESNLTNLQEVLYKLLENVTENYKNRLDEYSYLLLDIKGWFKEVIRNFTINVMQIQKKMEMEVTHGEGKRAREGVEAAEKEIARRILKMMEEVQCKRCDKCKQWRKLRNKTRADKKSNLLELRRIVSDLELIEKAPAVYDLRHIESKFGDGHRRQGSDWAAVRQANESSRLMKAWEDNTSQLETERQQQLQQLVEKSAEKESVWLKSFGEQIACKELIIKKESTKVFAWRDESDPAPKDLECHDLSPFSEQNFSALLKVLPALENATRSTTIASAIEIENSTLKTLMNFTSQLMKKAEDALRGYKQNILDDINYVWNGTCAVQRSVAEGYLKLKGLKRQLYRVKEGVSILRSGASVQSTFEDEETGSVTLETGGLEGLLVKQGEAVLKSSTLAGQAAAGNVSMRVSALLEQAEHVDGPKARGVSCAMWTGSETDFTTEQLVANLTGEIDVHDVLLEVHANVLRKVTRGEQQLASLWDAREKLEAKIEEARKMEECEPLWRQLLRHVLG
ncbi:hypothetical protein ERJ75_001213900 [Trypanosoma vivax]|nr:hypothetical protein ERJ75_001213900 [Trypanosoma vivax]